LPANRWPVERKEVGLIERYDIIGMKSRFPVKALDIVMILLALGLTGFSAFAVYVKPGNTAR
jgi:hypothetical protein